MTAVSPFVSTLASAVIQRSPSFPMRPLARLLFVLLIPSIHAAIPPHPSSQPHHLRHRGKSAHHKASEDQSSYSFLDTPQRDAPAPPPAPPSLSEQDEVEGADNRTIQGFIQSNCTSCLSRTEKRLAWVERIKREILMKIGVAPGHEPNASAKFDVPSLTNGPMSDLLRKYDLQSDSPSSGSRIFDPPNHSSAKTERIYSFARLPPPSFGFAESLNVSYFDFSPETRENEVTEAELNIFIKPPTAKEQIKESFFEVKVELFRMESSGKIHERPFKTQKDRFDLRSGGWTTIKIRRQVHKWFTKPPHNYGLHVRALHNGTGENLAVHPRDRDGKRNMYLDLTTREGERSSRNRREAPNLDCVEGGKESRCCRYKLVIDFEKFGWDWVIAPKKYMAYYCAGDCPFRYLQRFAHTHLVHQALPDGSAGPCCYPTDLAPIMMVYLNEQKEVLVSQVPGMIVNRCGCA